MKLNLAALALSSKTTEFDFPGIPGFTVTLTYLSREARRKLEEECKIQKLDESSGLPYMTLDTEKYTEKYVTATITGWKGLTLQSVGSLMLIDEDQIEDPEAGIDFNIETAKQLITHSERFDSWVSGRLANLDSFRVRKA